MHETERDVLARIEQTRARLGDTIEEIGDRVNPDRVQAEIKARAREQVHEVKENVKDKARNAMRDMEHEVSDAGRGLWDTIRENPIPAGMVGVGLAWLMANSSSGQHERDDRTRRIYREYPGAPRHAGHAGYTGAAYDDMDYAYDAERAAGYGVPVHRESEDRGLSDRASEVAGQARDTAQDTAHEVRERASHLAHRASEGMEDVQHKAGRAARDVGHRARRAERRVEHAVQDNPLAAGAIAAALGFAAGMMIPETQREHEVFGDTRDRMMDKAERTVKQAGEKAREVAKDTASESARRAVDEVTGGGSGRDRANVSEPGR